MLFNLSKWAYAQTAALEGCLTLAPGSEAAVWDNWSAKIWRNGILWMYCLWQRLGIIHLSNPLQNQWQNDAKSMNIYVGGCLLSHVGSRWHLLEAILAQDDREDRFSLIFRSILGNQNDIKIDEKMKWFSDALKNFVFCARRSQRLQNGGPKGIQNQGFSGI